MSTPPQTEGVCTGSIRIHAHAHTQRWFNTYSRTHVYAPVSAYLQRAHIRTRVNVSIAQSRLTLCNPMDGGAWRAGHGTLQAGTLEWVAMPSSRGSSRPRERACIAHMGRRVPYLPSRLGSPHVGVRASES